MYAWRKCTLFCVKKVCGMFAGLRTISTFASAIAEIAQLVEDVYKRQKVGTMIEIPRAALTADRIASSAEFFSFGTNDLTQRTRCV